MTTPDTSPGELEQLMQWMSVCVEHPEDATAAIRSDAGQTFFPATTIEGGAVVKPNDRMTPIDRLDVYNRGYFARLRGVLEMDFPVLLHALAQAAGDDAWNPLALEFCYAHPSRHQNLNMFNRPMPEFLAQRENLPHREFLSELAELEVRITKTHDAPEFTPFDMAKLAELTPEQWGSAVFVTNPSLQLLETEYPVNPYLQAVFQEDDPQLPERERSYVSVFRKDYKVWRHDLPQPMFRILEALQLGKPFGEALAAGGEHEEDFQFWFSTWQGDEVFMDVRA